MVKSGQIQKPSWVSQIPPRPTEHGFSEASWKAFEYSLVCKQSLFFLSFEISQNNLLKLEMSYYVLRINFRYKISNSTWVWTVSRAHLDPWPTGRGFGNRMLEDRYCSARAWPCLPHAGSQEQHSPAGSRLSTANCWWGHYEWSQLGSWKCKRRKTEQLQGAGVVGDEGPHRQVKGDARCEGHLQNQKNSLSEATRLS